MEIQSQPTTKDEPKFLRVQHRPSKRCNPMNMVTGQCLSDSHIFRHSAGQTVGYQISGYRLVVISGLYPVTIFPLAIPRGASPCISFAEKRLRINDAPDDLLPFRCIKNVIDSRPQKAVRHPPSYRLRTGFKIMLQVTIGAL